MLTKSAEIYYKKLLENYENSYFAEDKDKIIIGIDCDFLDGFKMDFSEFKAKFYELKTKKSLCKEAGLFGVLRANFINIFEKLPECEKKNYDFPPFLFADAKAYLIFEKNSKMYYKYGSKHYFKPLYEMRLKEEKSSHHQYFFKITNDLEAQKKDFFAMLEKAREYLLSGDIFQVVLSKQLCIETNIDSFEFYKLLSKENPSPYMFYFPTNYGVVLGSSPELVLSIKNKELFIAPIAGTRNLNEKSDFKALEKDLLSDEKELCEHRMLVDLARNDISKFGTNTRVKNAFSVVSYQFVMHILSEVYANLKDEASIFDAIAAVFPAGTLSGAPKIRALEIITELEGLDRGIYGGAIGFLRFNEDVILAILIRSGIFVKDKFYLASGAGIVLASDKEKEYAEIVAKRRSLLAVFENLAKKAHKTAPKVLKTKTLKTAPKVLKTSPLKSTSKSSTSQKNSKNVSKNSKTKSARVSKKGVEK